MFGTTDVRRECPNVRVVQPSNKLTAKLEEAARTEGGLQGNQRDRCVVGAAFCCGETRAPPT